MPDCQKLLLADAGYDEVTAGMYAMWVVAGMCLITATVVGFGLKKGTPTEEQKKIPYREQIRSGLAEGGTQGFSWHILPHLWRGVILSYSVLLWSCGALHQGSMLA